MLFLQKLGKAFLYTIGIFFILTFFITVLNYFNIFGPKLMTISKIIIPILSLFVGGVIMGKRSIQKGWLEGLKFSALIIVIIAIFNYVGFSLSFQVKQLLFYLILVISAMFGGMVGINLEKGETQS